MMKKIIRLLVLSMLVLSMLASVAMAQVAVLCYHEIDRANDDFSVTSHELGNQLSWLKKNGWHFVSLDEYLAYTRGQKKLPDKSVMITFDDGYESFYTKVYPLLQKYQIPGMLAIVTSWTDGEGKPTDVQKLATWDQLREMERSGLVTVVSHTHAMHKQQAIDPQGDRDSVAGNRLYLNDRYETDEEYRSRLNHDFQATQRLFQEKLGHPARVVVWPYGIYSAEAIKAAQDNGMEGSFLLDGGINGTGDKARLYAKRMIMTQDITIERFQKLLTKDHDEWNDRPLRMAQVDIDKLYDKDAQRFQYNIDSTIQQLRANGISLVALQAFADPDGDGNVDDVYFHNSVIPVKYDIFNHIANRMMQQRLRIVAWMPGLNYQRLGAKDGKNMVQAQGKGKGGWYHRLSPFDTKNIQQVTQLYKDLGDYTPVMGVMFQDDLYLNDFEDMSAAGKAAYKQQTGRDLEKLDHKNKKQMNEWTRMKTKQLTKVSLTLADAFKQHRPNAVILRDIYAEPVLNPESEEWFAQNYQDYLQNYDYTVVMAYPYMDGEKDPMGYLSNVAAAVKAAGGTSKTIVKIQTYDWKKERWLGRRGFNQQLQTLKKDGIQHLGYYPNTFYAWVGK